MGEMGNAYIILVRKLERMRPFGRPRHRWEGNIKVDPKKMCVDWIELAQDKV
jgi:hypothetical protein